MVDCRYCWLGLTRLHHARTITVDARLRHCGTEASPGAIVVPPPSSAPQRQPQTCLGQSDPRERRPRVRGSDALSPERANQSWAARCASLSGLAERANSTPGAWPWAGLSVPLRGGSDGTFTARDAWGDSGFGSGDAGFQRWRTWSVPPGPGGPGYGGAHRIVECSKRRRDRFVPTELSVRPALGAWRRDRTSGI